jgi:hypothetical protein
MVGRSNYSGCFGNTEIDSTKTPLFNGQIATFANYTSYVHGLNRVVVDVAGLASSSLTTDDFEFRIGNSDTPESWTVLDGGGSVPLPTVGVVSDGGSNQVVLAWPNGTLTNTWLQTTIKANQNTGLTTSDIFYFGNAIGESGNNSSDARVNLADVGGARTNQTGFGTTGIENNYDFNRDTRVNLSDVAIARLNQSGFSPLRLIDLSGSNRNNFGQSDDGKQSTFVTLIQSGFVMQTYVELNSTHDNQTLLAKTAEERSLSQKYKETLALAGKIEFDSTEIDTAFISLDRRNANAPVSFSSNSNQSNPLTVPFKSLKRFQFE